MLQPGQGQGLAPESGQRIRIGQQGGVNLLVGNQSVQLPVPSQYT